MEVGVIQTEGTHDIILRYKLYLWKSGRVALQQTPCPGFQPPIKETRQISCFNLQNPRARNQVRICKIRIILDQQVLQYQPITVTLMPSFPKPAHLSSIPLDDCITSATYHLLAKYAS